MSIVLNEAAIASFFQSDPRVAAKVELEAVKIVEAMREDVQSYFVSRKTGQRVETRVEDDVRLRMEGTRAIVALENDPDGHSTHPGKTKSARYARLGKWETTHDVAAGRRR